MGICVCRMKHRERSSQGRLGLKVYFSQLEKCKTHTWPETSMKRCFICGVTVMSRIVRPYSMTTTVLDLLLSQLARFIEEILEVGPCTQPPQVDHLRRFDSQERELQRKVNTWYIFTYTIIWYISEHSVVPSDPIPLYKWIWMKHIPN